MRYYKEFIDFIQEDIASYFKNVNLFKNQFQFNEYSQELYNKIFLAQRNCNSIKTIAQLKKEIPGYADLYKEASNFYLNPRNKSVKGLDVQMGRYLEELLMNYLKYKFKLNVMHADVKNKKYPDCMLLGTDKGILAYFEVKYHNAPFIRSKNLLNREPYESSATLDVKKVAKQLEIIDSELDRPTFYVHWVDYHDLKGIFFESSQQVKEYLYENSTQFTRNKREGDFVIKKKVGYTEKIYSPLFEMGTFEEFINILLDLKKNGVPMVDY